MGLKIKIKETRIVQACHCGVVMVLVNRIPGVAEVIAEDEEEDVNITPNCCC